MPSAFVHSRSSTARGGGEAMETFLNAFRDGYARVAGARERWDDAQKASTALLGAVVNAFERMPALERGATREDVLGNDEFGKRVVEAQYASLDRLFTRLREECDEFERLTRELERAKTDAWMRTRNLTPPPKRAGGERSGPQPSIAECVLGLEDVWRMHRDECALKREIVKQAATCEDVEDLKVLHRLYCAQPNLDPEELRTIMDRVPVKSVEADLHR